jgi:hypothetical protein
MSQEIGIVALSLSQTSSATHDAYQVADGQEVVQRVLQGLSQILPIFLSSYLPVE